MNQLNTASEIIMPRQRQHMPIPDGFPTYTIRVVGYDVGLKYAQEVVQTVTVGYRDHSVGAK